MAKKKTTAKKKTRAKPPPKKSKRRATQMAVPGTERPRIPEISDAAEAYADARDERLVLLKLETQQADLLKALLAKHGIKIYVDEDLGLEVFLQATDIKVKVKRMKSEDDE